MEINVKAFQDAIQAENYEQMQHVATPEAATAALDQALAPLFSDLDAALAAGKLLQTQLTITSAEPTLVRLETGVINLPFADSKKVSNFIDSATATPLNVYLIVVSPYVNVSGLRIDLVASADAYEADRGANQAAVVAEVQEKLALIETNRTAPAPAPAAAPAKRATTRTTTRKTATKRTTTRKPAAKKPTTTKAAAKKASPKATTKSASKATAKKAPAKKTTARKPAAKKATTTRAKKEAKA